MRLAIGLGLHRRIGPDRASPSELERRRRTWWSIYNFDRVASFTLVRPLGIADEAIDIEVSSIGRLEYASTDKRSSCPP